METPSEAFKTWFNAYSNNYGSGNLMDSEIVAEQAWLACCNYHEQELAALREAGDTLANIAKNHVHYDCRSSCAICKQVQNWRKLRGEGSE